MQNRPEEPRLRQIQNQLDNLKSALDSKNAKEAKLTIILGTEPVYQVSEDGSEIGCVISDKSELKGIIDLIHTKSISTPELNLEFKYKIGLDDRTICLHTLTDELHKLKNIKSAAVKGSVKDYALSAFLLHKSVATLSRLELETGYADEDRKVPVNKNSTFEESLVNYMAHNPRLKSLRIEDMDSQINIKTNPKLKKALREHPRLIQYSQGWGGLLKANNVPLDKDREVMYSFDTKIARNPKVVKQKLDGMFLQAIQHANDLHHSLETIIIVRKQIHPKEDTWKTAATHLASYIANLNSLRQQLVEFTQQTQEDYSKQLTVIPALIQYASLLELAATFKSAIEKDKSLECYADEIEKFWDIERPKINAIVKAGNIAAIQDSCTLAYTNLRATYEKAFPGDKAKLKQPSVKNGATTASAVADPDKQLENSIKALEDYGNELKSKHYPVEKYQPVLNLAIGIQNEVNNFREKISTADETSKNLKRLIKEGKKQMRGNRRLQDIIGHIALCLTGIGLIVLGARWAATGKFFINTTEREKRLKEVNKALKVNQLRK